MRPILFQVWRFPIYSYGFSLALAFVIGTWLVYREAKRRGLDADKMIDLALYVCISGILGARLVFVLLELPQYMGDPMSILRLKDGGLSFHGGLAVAMLVGVWFCRRNKLSAGVVADIVAPAVALGYAIVRVGCLLNGCCYGVPAEVPWALPAAADDGTLRHPTQIYSAILSFGLFAYLWTQRDHKKFPGYLMFMYVGIYSVTRFFVEIFRDTPRFLGPLSLAQIVSVIFAVGAFACIWVLSQPSESAPTDHTTKNAKV